jgi:ketosteroid isomerase-like protein
MADTKVETVSTAQNPFMDLMVRGHKAFATRDMAALREINAENIEWYTPGDHPLSGRLVGIDAVLGWMKKSAEVTNGTFRVEIHRIVADEEYAVAISTYRGERKGIVLEMPGVQIFRRDPVRNQIIEARIWVYDDVFVNRFWSA